ncbi:MAG: hypothetical protein HYV45_03450 [Candidatus Moranbacteria bacterium]|nr:hypothetical protein [Candidatus Moranbacteria bacterium]
MFGFFLRFFWKKQRVIALEIAGRLRGMPSVQNFQDSFYRGFSRYKTTDILATVVKKGLMSWEELGFKNAEHAEKHFKAHLIVLIDLYLITFPVSFWQSYKHTQKGLEAFLTLTLWNLVPNDISQTIRRRFAKELYFKLKKEQPTLSEGEIFKKIAKDCLISEGEILEGKNTPNYRGEDIRLITEKFHAETFPQPSPHQSMKAK